MTTTTKMTQTLTPLPLPRPPISAVPRILFTYPAEWAEEDDAYSTDFICPRCDEVLAAPLSCPDCLGSLCASCWRESRCAKDIECPLCRAPRDHAGDDLLASPRVFVDFLDRVTVACAICGFEMQRGEIPQHFVDEDASADTQIFMRDLTGVTRNLLMGPHTTVWLLKEQAERIMDVPAHTQRLLYAGKTLDDDEPLSRYNITKESTLHLLLRLVGD